MSSIVEYWYEAMDGMDIRTFLVRSSYMVQHSEMGGPTEFTSTVPSNSSVNDAILFLKM